jgi:hypothetical protein
MCLDPHWKDSTDRADVRLTAASYAIGAIGYYLTSQRAYTIAERLESIAAEVDRLDRVIKLTLADDFDVQAATDLAMGREL